MSHPTGSVVRRRRLIGGDTGGAGDRGIREVRDVVPDLGRAGDHVWSERRSWERLVSGTGAGRGEEEAGTVVELLPSLMDTVALFGSCS